MIFTLSLARLLTLSVAAFLYSNWDFMGLENCEMVKITVWVVRGLY